MHTCAVFSLVCQRIVFLFLISSSVGRCVEGEWELVTLGSCSYTLCQRKREANSFTIVSLVGQGRQWCSSLYFEDCSYPVSSNCIHDQKSVYFWGTRLAKVPEGSPEYRGTSGPKRNRLFGIFNSSWLHDIMNCCFSEWLLLWFTLEIKAPA